MHPFHLLRPGHYRGKTDITSTDNLINAGVGGASHYIGAHRQIEGGVSDDPLHLAEGGTLDVRRLGIATRTHDFPLQAVLVR